MKVHVWEEGGEWHFLIRSRKELAGRSGFRDKRDASLAAALNAKTFGFHCPWQIVKQCGCVGESVPGLPVPSCGVCGKPWEFEWQTEGKP